jgi:transposase
MIFMESCYSANYWGRLFESHGFKVKLIPAQHVKPFVKGNKNDKHDALAIAEASMRPGIYFVPIKSVEQQDIQCLHRVRQRLISYRTGLSNQIRGLIIRLWNYFPQRAQKCFAFITITY